jgi:hypothetical protein
VQPTNEIVGYTRASLSTPYLLESSILSPTTVRFLRRTAFPAQTMSRTLSVDCSPVKRTIAHCHASRDSPPYSERKANEVQAYISGTCPGPGRARKRRTEPGVKTSMRKKHTLSFHPTKIAPHSHLLGSTILPILADFRQLLVRSLQAAQLTPCIDWHFVTTVQASLSEQRRSHG